MANPEVVFQELEEENERLLRVIEGLRGQIKILQTEKGNLARNLEEKEASINRLQQECVAHQEGMAALRSSFEDEIAKLKQQHVIEKLELRKKLRILESRARSGHLAVPPTEMVDLSESAQSAATSSKPTAMEESATPSAPPSDRDEDIDSQHDVDEEYKPTSRIGNVQPRRRSSRLLARGARSSYARVGVFNGSQSFLSLKHHVPRKKPVKKEPRTRNTVQDIQSVLVKLRNPTQRLNQEESALVAKTLQAKMRQHILDTQRKRERRAREKRNQSPDIITASIGRRLPTASTSPRSTSVVSEADGNRTEDVAEAGD